MNTSVETLENNNVKLTVTAPADEVDAAIAGAYAAVAGKVKIPGFRKGKAPRPVIDNFVGREVVMGEATEALVNATYPRAVDAEGLRPISSPELAEDAPDVAPGEPYTYEVEIEVRPELTLADSDQIVVKVPPREASDEEIDAQVEQVRERFATLEPVDDRPVAAEDFVLLSFTGTVDGEPYEGNVVDKYLYELGRGLMPPAFDEGLVGMSVGEDKRIEFDIPETGSNDEFAGKKAGFDVTIHEVKAKSLPEIDAEFATTVGGFESVEELRDDIRTRINVQRGESHPHLLRRGALEALAAKLEGDIPETMVGSRANEMMEDFLEMLDQRQMTLEQYLSATQTELEGLYRDVALQAEQAMREELALEALYRAQGLDVTDEEYDAEIAALAEASGVTPEMMGERLSKSGLTTAVRWGIIRRKAVDWLLENVKVEEIPFSAVAGESDEA